MLNVRRYVPVYYDQDRVCDEQTVPDISVNIKEIKDRIVDRPVRKDEAEKAGGKNKDKSDLTKICLCFFVFKESLQKKDEHPE